MLPVQVQNFLAASAPAEAISREQALLAQLQTSEPTDTFKIADGLQTLYMRYFRAGGMQGRLWLDERKQGLVRQIAEENLYPDFLRFQGSEATFQLPSSITPPLSLRFSEEMGRPAVIPLETPAQPFTHKAAYFLLSDLFFEDSKITPQEMAQAQVQLQSGNIRNAVQITRHHRTGQHLVRSNPALCKALSDNGYPYVLGWVDNVGFFSRSPWRVSDLKIVERVVVVRSRLEPIAPAPFQLGFTARRDLHFAPRATTLRRYGKPYPVVFEQQDYAGLMALASKDQQKDLETRRPQGATSQSLPFLLAVRSPEGAMEGYCVNILASDRKSLCCDRDYKSDLSPETGIQFFGLALTMARLIFLKESGYWPEYGAVLTNFIPQVSHAYKSLVGLPTAPLNTFGHQLDTISRHEAEVFLERNPLHFEPI